MFFKRNKLSLRFIVNVRIASVCSQNGSMLLHTFGTFCVLPLRTSEILVSCRKKRYWEKYIYTYNGYSDVHVLLYEELLKLRDILHSSSLDVVNKAQRVINLLLSRGQTTVSRVEVPSAKVPNIRLNSSVCCDKSKLNSFLGFTRVNFRAFTKTAQWNFARIKCMLPDLLLRRMFCWWNKF